MTQEIIENNCLIASFMGLERTEKETGEPTFKQEHNAVVWASQLLYDTSWDWLMPVVEKICSLKIGDDITYVKYAYIRTFVYNEDTNEFFVRLNGFQMFKSKTLIESLYIAVIDFIKWYNHRAMPICKDCKKPMDENAIVETGLCTTCFTSNA